MGFFLVFLRKLTVEYCMYFLFFILRGWRKRSAVQPQTIYSEFP